MSVNSRAPFSSADDALLDELLLAEPQNKWRGNEIYKDLARKHPSHPWQSWRNRAVRKVVPMIEAKSRYLDEKEAREGREGGDKSDRGNSPNKIDSEEAKNISQEANHLEVKHSSKEFLGEKLTAKRKANEPSEYSADIAAIFEKRPAPASRGSPKQSVESFIPIDNEKFGKITEIAVKGQIVTVDKPKSSNFEGRFVLSVEPPKLSPSKTIAKAVSPLKTTVSPSKAVSSQKMAPLTAKTTTTANGRPKFFKIVDDPVALPEKIKQTSNLGQIKTISPETPIWKSIYAASFPANNTPLKSSLIAKKSPLKSIFTSIIPKDPLGSPYSPFNLSSSGKDKLNDIVGLQPRRAAETQAETTVNNERDEKVFLKVGKGSSDSVKYLHDINTMCNSYSTIARDRIHRALYVSSGLISASREVIEADFNWAALDETVRAQVFNSQDDLWLNLGRFDLLHKPQDAILRRTQFLNL